MRSFIAIPISRQVRIRLVQLAEEIGNSGVRGRPVRSDAVHLTLKFLGEIKAQQVPEILTALEQTARQCQAFRIRAQSLGVFPSRKRPRVLWAGLIPENPIVGLQKKLEQSLEEIGVSPENRPFHPHLTLLRIREIQDRQSFNCQIERNSEVSFGVVEVREIVLFESLLKPSGAEYNVWGRAQLQPDPSRTPGMDSPKKGSSSNGNQ